MLNPSCNLIIPARGGSKEIPYKNIALLGKIPLIAHTIQSAKASSAIKKVYVSTDSNEIAEVSRQYGAEVIKRPSEIACDLSSSEAAILHALDVIEKEQSLTKYTCMAQCTSPFTSSIDFDQGIEVITKDDYDSLFSATQFNHFIWNYGKDQDLHGINHDHNKKRLMRQEKPVEYLETGSFYIFKTDKFREVQNRFFGKIGICEIPSKRVFEIDSKEDLIQANLLFKGQENESAT